MKLVLKKQFATRPGFCLVGMDESTQEYLDRLPTNTELMGNFTRPRNLAFHKKYFALLQVGFEHFEPPELFKGNVVGKNFDAFREQCIIGAGFYDVVYSITGDPRYIAKSISFANMSEHDFSDLYSKTIDVLLKYVLKSYTRDDIDEVVNEVLGFG